MHFLATGERLPDPSIEEQYILITEQYRDMLSHYGAENGVNIARKHIGWYTKGLHGSAEFRNLFNKEPDPVRALHMLGQFYALYLSKAAA
jgi:tRNA-dihydrouridine synthase B